MSGAHGARPAGPSSYPGARLTGSRPSLRLTIVALVATATAAAGCPSDPAPSECGLQSVPVASNPLTLLPDARIDHVRDFFVLLGTDGNNVRWAKLGLDGQVGDWHEVVVPAHTDGPWFAVGGVGSSADHLVVAYAVAGAAGAGMADLMTFSAPFDNATSAAAVARVGQVPDVRSRAATITMASGRAGLHAGLVWAVQGTTDVTTLILDGDGHAIGGEVTIAQMQTFGLHPCLRFSPGKQDMTVGFVDSSGTPPTYTFVGTEISDTGVVQPSFKLTIGAQTDGCVEIVPTDSAYGVAWHSTGIGYFFGVYNPTTSGFPSQLVLDNVSVKGALPVLGGIGWTGKNYTLVFGHPSGAEMWEIDALGHRIGGALVFPSTNRNTGTLSTQPVGTTLYGTYADYASPVLTNQSMGQRLLVHLTCP